MSVHVLVPGDWTVQRSHDVLEEVEADLRAAVADLHVLTHVEPSEDPRAYGDYAGGIDIAEALSSRERYEDDDLDY
jgi:divalent metal cation (Fe/Co/Zn/Cd) transporter